MYDAIVRSLQTVIESSLSEINTSVPGTVISYNAQTNRAVVRPDLPKRLASDEVLQPPDIVEVPMVWTSSGGGASTFTMPIKPGDGVMLSFQQRSLEGWLSGVKDIPDDPRQFDLSDCVAIPGCQSSGISADPNDVVLKFNKTEVRIKPDGTIVLGNDNGNITIDGSGNMTLNAASIHVVTPARSFVLETHVHTGVQIGLGNTSMPV